jgi:chromosome partitioning protein
MRKIAIAMAKGGVGKTTTAVNLAYQIAQTGKRVLLVDCDTQNQVSQFLDVKPQYGLYEFITGASIEGEPITRNEAIFPARKNMWLLSGGMSLAILKNWIYEETNESERQSIIAKKLNPKNGSLDYIIYDCAPGWDILSVNILVASNEILCPVTLEGAAMKGLKDYIHYIGSAKKVNKDLEIKYIVPTMYDRRTRQARDILNQLKKVFGDKVCNKININVRLSESASHGQTIFEYSPRAIGALDYQKLAKRIMKNGNK